MNNYENRTIYFAGRGNKIEKNELEKYFIQNGATLIENMNEATVIIEGKFTPINLEDVIYEKSKNGIEVFSIEKIEKEFSFNLDIDSVLMAIKISKDNDRLIKLLNNNYFDDDTFIKLLKFYDFKDNDIYDTDENRDVCTVIVERFCQLAKTNHNIQYSPIGVYYTALETTNSKLLDIMYLMPEYKISDRNTGDNQPLSLKEVVALNPNSSKVMQLQILKNNKKNELKFLAANESISNSISKKLAALNDDTITKALISAGNFDESLIDKFLLKENIKKVLLKAVVLNDKLFTKICSSLDEVGYINLSSNNSLSKIMIDIIFEKNIDNANINLLKNKNCSKVMVDKFLIQNDKVYNIAIAHNESLDEHAFNKLLHAHDLDVNISLSGNINTPKEIFKQLVMLNNQMINEVLCANESTPINILMQFQFDGGLKPILSNNETFRAFTRNLIGM